MSDWKKVPPFELGKNMPAQPAPASAKDSKPLSAREFYRDVYKPDVADVADTFEFAEVYASYCSAADRQRIAELEKGASTPADIPEWLMQHYQRRVLSIGQHRGRKARSC